MKLRQKVIVVIILLVAVISLIAKNNLYIKSEISEIVTSNALNADDYTDALTLSVEKIHIEGIKKDWSLCGLDQNGYYFTSNEHDGRIEFYYYDKISNFSKKMVYDIGNCIYNTYFKNQKMYMIAKETGGAPDGGDTLIVEVNMREEKIETIYKDGGKKYPEYFFHDNNLVIANSYEESENVEIFKITMINLEDRSVKVLKSVASEDSFLNKQEQLLRIAGTQDYLYAEIGKNIKEEGKGTYTLMGYDLKTGKVTTINLKEAMDYIAGHENLFVSRIYATGAPLANNAMAFNVYNSKTHVYEQHKIYHTDSTNQPYELGKINGYYVLLLSKDIILVDIKALTFDVLNYRSKNGSECISPPFIIGNKVYYMKEILEDENFNREIYIYEIH